jgi:hypothetical protein
MSNQAKSGLGLSVISGTTIYGEVIDAQSPSSTLDTTDTTSHNNLAGVKTDRPTWISNGTMSVDMNYVGNTEQDALFTMYYAKTVSTWYIVAPVAFTRAWSFQGYLSELPTPKFDKSGNASMSFKVKVTGQVTAITTAVVGLTTPFVSVTDQGSTSLTLSPAAANATYAYQVTTDLADTGVKVTPTDGTSNEVIYVNNTLVASGAASGAITIGTSAGDVIMVPVVIFKTACVPKVYWIEVTHGAV